MMRQAAASAGVMRRSRWAPVLVVLIVVAVVTVALAQPARAQAGLGMDGYLRAVDDEELDDEDRIPPHRYVITAGFQDAGEGGGNWLSDAVSVVSPGAGMLIDGVTSVGGAVDAVADIPEMIVLLLVNMTFAIAKALAVIGLWIIEFAYKFKIIEWMDEPAANLSERFQADFVELGGGGVGLGDLAVFLAVFYCGMQLLRRRTSHGLGELVLSIAIAIIGATLVANPIRTLQTTVPWAIGTAGAVLEIGTGGDVDTGVADSIDPDGGIGVGAATADYQALLNPLREALWDATIVQPYDIINFGRLLRGSCATARDEHLQSDNWEDGGELRDAIEDAGCAPEADFNAAMATERLVLALLAMVANGLFLLLEGFVGVGLMMAQFLLVQLLVIMPLAWVAGVVPGTGRQLLLRWANAFVKSLAALAIATFLFTMFIVAVEEVFSLEDVSLMGRYMIVVVAIVMVFRGRGVLRDISSEIITHGMRKFETRSPSGGPSLDLLDADLRLKSIWRARIKERLVDSTYAGVAPRLRRAPGATLRAGGRAAVGAGRLGGRAAVGTGRAARQLPSRARGLVRRRGGPAGPPGGGPPSAPTPGPGGGSGGSGGSGGRFGRLRRGPGRSPRSGLHGRRPGGSLDDLDPIDPLGPEPTPVRDSLRDTVRRRDVARDAPGMEGEGPVTMSRPIWRRDKPQPATYEPPHTYLRDPIWRSRSPEEEERWRVAAHRARKATDPPPRRVWATPEYQEEAAKSAASREGFMRNAGWVPRPGGGWESPRPGGDG